MERVVDANVHVGPTVYEKFEFEPTFEQLSNQMDVAGIDAAIVSPLTPPSLDYDSANEKLAQEADNRDRFYGIGRVDPRREDAPDHVDTTVDEYGLHGIQLHPWEETFSITDSFVAPVLERASDHNVPVWVHAGYPGVSHALLMLEVAQEFPDTTFVLTHGSQLDISGLSLTDALMLAEEAPNTIFDMSGVYRRDFIQDMVETAGSQRVVFGSNTPYFHPEVEKSRITDVDIDEADKTDILVNGESLIDS